MPSERQSLTHKFSIGGHDGYVTIGEYDDGTPGEIFVVMAKEGSTVSGLMDTVATLTSIALQTLGYSDEQVEQIEAHINEAGTIVGAPGLLDEHLPVFDVAVGERAISHLGHIKMMGAVQPFISGAISKTVNLPESVTVEDIAEIYSEGWKLGL